MPEPHEERMILDIHCLSLLEIESQLKVIGAKRAVAWPLSTTESEDELEYWLWP